MASGDWQGFLARFSRFGEHPTQAGYFDLFAPEGSVLHPGMTRPLAGAEIAAFISQALSAMPDFRLRPVRWAAGEQVLFVEAANSGTADGRAVTWPAIYCVTLRDDRVARGRSYYDRAAVLAHLEPDLAARRNEAHALALAGDPLGSEQRGGRSAGTMASAIARVEAYVAAWGALRFTQAAGLYPPGGRLLVPGEPDALPAREIADHWRARFAGMSGLALRCENQAVQSGHAFLEWRMTGSVQGRAFELGGAERLSFDGDRFAEGMSYFDTLSWQALCEPQTARGTIFDPSRDTGGS